MIKDSEINLNSFVRLFEKSIFLFYDGIDFNLQLECILTYIIMYSHVSFNKITLKLHLNLIRIKIFLQMFKVEPYSRDVALVFAALCTLRQSTIYINMYLYLLFNVPHCQVRFSIKETLTQIMSQFFLASCTKPSLKHCYSLRVIWL